MNSKWYIHVYIYICVNRCGCFFFQNYFYVHDENQWANPARYSYMVSLLYNSFVHLCLHRGRSSIHLHVRDGFGHCFWPFWKTRWWCTNACNLSHTPADPTFHVYAMVCILVWIITKNAHQIKSTSTKYMFSVCIVYLFVQSGRLTTFCRVWNDFHIKSQLDNWSNLLHSELTTIYGSRNF